MQFSGKYNNLKVSLRNKIAVQGIDACIINAERASALGVLLPGLIF